MLMNQYNARLVNNPSQQAANVVKDAELKQCPDHLTDLRFRQYPRPVTRMVGQSRSLQNPIAPKTPSNQIPHAQHHSVIVEPPSPSLSLLVPPPTIQPAPPTLTNKQPHSRYKALFATNSTDPQHVFEYCEEIHLTQLEDEQERVVTVDYMLTQPHITPRYREVLVDWLSAVRSRYRLRHDTFALCVAILDRFLERREITKERLQLLGCVALWVAAKYEEVHSPPSVEEFVRIAERYTREEFVLMERILLQVIDYRLTIPYAHQFADRFIIGLKNTKLYDDAAIDSVRFIALYLIEMSYQYYEFVGHLTSQIATAAISLALFSLKFEDHFPLTLIDASGYQYADIKELFCDLWETASKLHQKHILKRQQQDQNLTPQRISDSVYRLYLTDNWKFAPRLIPEFKQSACPP